MASVPTVDCFHDNSEDADDAFIMDVEWSKLEDSHRKDGFREGHSDGQERALQPAFNRGFSERVKVETRAAFYKGILTALKTLSEKLSRSNRLDTPVSLTADDAIKLESLLAELDESTRGSGSNRGTVKTTPLDELVSRTASSRSSEPSRSQRLLIPTEGTSADNRTDSSEEDANRKQCCSNEQGCACKGAQHPGKNASVGGIPAQNEGVPCGKLSQSMSTTTPGNQPMARKPEGGSAEEATAAVTSDSPAGAAEFDISEGGTPDDGMLRPVTQSGDHCTDMKHISKHCKQLLQQLGIENLLLENQYTKDV